MTRKFKLSCKNLIFILVFFLSIFPLFSEDETKWVIAAEKFSYAKGQKETALLKSLSENLPASILEKLSQNQFRSVLPSENLERTRFKLRKERQSLFLQLSSEYKKRDTLFMYDYSKWRLKRAIAEEEKKIKAIQKKIDENIAELKKAEEEAARKIELYEGPETSYEEKNDFQKFTDLLGGIFINEESYVSLEELSFYKDDITSLFQISDKLKDEAHDSAAYAKEVYNAGINSLITGSISAYGDYLSVNVELYLYPAGEKLGSVMEVGTIQELELMAMGIAGQIVPLITNALPVKFSLSVSPEAINPMVYVDEKLITEGFDDIRTTSGKHTVLVSADGYETVSVSEFFEGNKAYSVEVNMSLEKKSDIQVGLIKPVLGDLYINGNQLTQISQQKYIIQLNGSKSLGEFVAADGNTAFFYIPQNLIKDGSMVKIKPKAIDRSEYLDVRRKWAYASYSIFVLSLIPAFYTYSNFVNQVRLYNDLYATTYDEAVQWQNASRLCVGISVACGVFWGFELMRYFMAANSTLPQKARAGDVVEVELPDLNLPVQEALDSPESDLELEHPKEDENIEE